LKIRLNGEDKETEEGTTLPALIESLSLAPERIAVELNGEVIRRAEWPRVKLNEGDRVEVVHFVGGGDSEG
jgi:thiamine biosynthesis protein ThiS